MRSACLLLLVMMCLATVPVQTEDKPEFPGDSGNAFIRLCSAVDKPFKELTELEQGHAVACLGYVSGLADGIWLELDLLRTDGSPQHGPYCESGGVEQGQRVRVLMKYIQDNPAKAHLRTSALFGLAMKKAFPCPAIDFRPESPAKK
jgi:Rap1a immunity proteins